MKFETLFYITVNEHLGHVWLLSVHTIQSQSC